jgi:NitT/TauT family transport system substrate-binding protein
MTTRRTFLAGAAATSLACPARAAGPTEVTVGSAQAISEAIVYIAEKKRYFADEDIAIKILPFASAANMVAPLGAGQLDVGGGSASAGLYNAVLRGIKIKIVADKSSSQPGYGSQQILVRKDHIESGRYKTIADLKGFRFAMNGVGVSNTSTLNTLLTSAGLKYSDVSTVNLQFPDHVLAFENKSVDASSSLEPFVTAIKKAGTAVVIRRDDEIIPGHELANLLYSQSFAARRDVAVRFMRAYLRGVRFYNDSLRDHRLAGPLAEETIDILAEYTPIKDKALLRELTPAGCDPDGRVSMESLQRDLDFYASQGLIEGKVDLSEIVDSSFLEAALKDLGPYKPAK